MTGLESFSDWVLAVLPRLFLYPGGLWLLAALLVLRVASGGIAAVRPQVLARDFLSTSLPALALAWVAVALGPSVVSGQWSVIGGQWVVVDRFALVALPLLSLALDERRSRSDVWAAFAITLALLAPLAATPALLMAPVDLAFSLSGVLSMLAVAMGLIALGQEIARDLAGAVRWLAWLGLGLGASGVGSGEWGEWSIVYVMLIVTLALLARLGSGFKVWGRAADAMLLPAGLLAGVSLLTALVKF